MFRSTLRSGVGRRGRFSASGQGSSSGEIALGLITLHNNGTVAVEPRARFGMAWVKGRFYLSTHRLRIRVSGGNDVAFAALVGRNSYTDGSVHTTADGGVVLHDTTPLAAGASRTYEVYAAPGSQPEGTFDPWAWISAHANDFTVEITNRTGSSTGARSNLSFSLKTAVSNTARREIVNRTAQFVRTKVWQKLDGEEHLICEFHHDFWLDASGDVQGIEWTAVMSQHWWVNDPFGVSQPRERQNYDATVRYGSTVVDSRTGLAHAYHCRWASLRPDNDPQHARKHWVNVSGAPMPTIRVQYSDAVWREMIRAGAAPPQGDSPIRAPVSRTYTPLGTNGHNSSIMSGGGYLGRGVWDEDSAKIISHSPGGSGRNPDGAWRAARVSAQGGLGFYGHLRDHRSGSVGKIIPAPFRQITGGTQSYAGLGATVLRSRNNSFSPFPPHPQWTWVDPHGGTGAFSGYDSAHATNYSTAIAFLEAEHYLADAALSSLDFNLWHFHFNEYVHDAQIYYQGTSYNPPPTRFGTLPSGIRNEDRALAWSLNFLGRQWILTDDRSIERPYVLNVIRNVENYLTTSANYISPAHYNRGLLRMHRPYATGQWQVGMRIMTAYMAHLALRDHLPVNTRGMNGIQESAFLDARFIRRTLAQGLYFLGANLIGVSPSLDPTIVFSDNWYPCAFSFAINNGLFTVNGMLQGLDTLVDGLRVQFTTHDGNMDPKPTPAPFQAGVDYWTVQTSGNTFRLASTPGGSPIGSTVVQSSNLPLILIAPPSYNRTQIGPNPPYFMPPSDHFLLIAHAAVQYARGMGHPDYDAAFCNAVDTFMAPYFTPTRDVFVNWVVDYTKLQES